MLTRLRKRALQSIDSGDELTILALPDVPLLLVLSHLSLKDLRAAGQAHPRLGLLTRKNASLWRGKGEMYFPSVAELLDLVLMMPTVCTLKCEVDQSYKVILAQLENVASPSTGHPTALTLAVKVPTMSKCVSILQKVKPQLAHLVLKRIRGVGLGLFHQRVLAPRSVVVSLDIYCYVPEAEVVRDLTSVGSSLRHLTLRFEWGWRWAPEIEQLFEQALAALPNLHSLHMLQENCHLHSRPSEVLCRLSVDVISKLSLIFCSYFDREVSSSLDPSSLSDFQKCQDLVRRSPGSLHVIVVVTQIYSSHPILYELRERCFLVFRHSTAEPSVALCPLCAEAQAAVTLHCPCATEIYRVQVQ